MAYTMVNPADISFSICDQSMNPGQNLDGICPLSHYRGFMLAGLRSQGPLGLPTIGVDYCLLLKDSPPN